MRVAFVKPVVDEQRTAVVMGHPTTHINDRVLMHPKQRLEPNHHRAIAHGGLRLAEPPASLTQILGQIHAAVLAPWLI